MTNNEEFDWTSVTDLDIEHLLASFDRHPEIKTKLQSAEIVLVPSNIRLQYAGRNVLHRHEGVWSGDLQEDFDLVFPSATKEFHELLREEFGDHANIEVRCN